MFFRCSSGGGKGNNLIVTCASDFAGVTINCTNGTKTYSRVCPSSDPYEVEFNGLEAGTWTISGTVNGSLYSTTVVVTDFTATLQSGFDYKAWVDLSQNYHSTDYNSLADVFADEGALRELMTIHDCCDYLIDAVNDDIDVIDDFVANDTAMKWIGLRDYVCDGLTAINGVEAKFLASEYWERYLKDHVPTMTSNTAPYGTVSRSGVYGNSFEAWHAFDGIEDANNRFLEDEGTGTKWFGYQSPSPICPKRWYVALGADLATVKTRLSAIALVGSNDGATWETLDTVNTADLTVNKVDRVANISDYYLHLRVNLVKAVSNGVGVLEAQFYGRMLGVSVPSMTSNTAPFGEVRSNSTYDGNYYKPFGKIVGSSSGSGIYNLGQGGETYIEHVFTSKIVPKQLVVVSKKDDYELLTCKVYGSNDGTNYTELTADATKTYNGTMAYLCVDLSTLNEYEIVRIGLLTSSQNEARTIAVNSYAMLYGVLIFGKDYSEKEFETGTTKKWLYDHGVELDTLTYRRGSASSDAIIEEAQIYFQDGTNNSVNTYCVVVSPKMDLSDYSIVRAKCGDKISGANFYIGCVTDVSYFPENGTYDYNNTYSNLLATNRITEDASQLPNNISLDISAINSMACIFMGEEYASGKATLAEFWLEA